MRAFKRIIGASLVIGCLMSNAALAAPSVTAGYTIDVVVTGIGANDGMTFGPDGLLYLTDHSRNRVLRLESDGSITVVATGVSYVNDIAFTSEGRLFAVGDVLYELTGGLTRVFSGSVSGAASIEAQGNSLFVGNSGNGTITRFEMDGTMTVVLSGFSTYGGPFGVSLGPNGRMYFVDHATGRVFSYDFLNSPGQLATVTPFGGVFTSVAFNGQLLVSDYQAGTVWAISSDGTMSAFATGFTGATYYPVIGPTGLAFDGSTLYVGDGDTLYRIARAVPDTSRIRRAMTVIQRKSGDWNVVCKLHYGAIDGSHTYDISLFAGGPNVVTLPYGGTVSPSQSYLFISDGGTTTLAAKLLRNSIEIERTFNLPAAPRTGDVYYCQGGATDRTVGKQLRSVLMNDVTK